VADPAEQFRFLAPEEFQVLPERERLAYLAAATAVLKYRSDELRKMLANLHTVKPDEHQ
jgi:hypothetical protein